MFSYDKLETLLMPLSSMDMGTRTRNGLENNDIHYFAQLLTLTKGSIPRMLNFGTKSLNDVEEVVREKGFEAGCLSKYRWDMPSDGVTLREFLLEKIVYAEVTNTTDAFAGWVMENLPDKLKQGLKPEFLDAVLHDPQVRQDVGNVVANAVAEQLGLNGGP